MEDREALLDAIEMNPGEDIPRLMYADCLFEDPKSDLDEATVEFIKISCRNKEKKIQYRDEGKWVHSNWQRIIPSLVEDGFQFKRRDGRNVHLYQPYQITAWNGRKLDRKRWLTLEFWKGFVASARFFYYEDALKVVPKLIKDQRNVLLEVDLYPMWSRRNLMQEGELKYLQCYTLDESRCKEVYPFIENYDTEIHKSKLFIGAEREKAVKNFSNALKKYCLSL